jgi:hypothetical protein
MSHHRRSQTQPRLNADRAAWPGPTGIDIGQFSPADEARSRNSFPMLLVEHASHLNGTVEPPLLHAGHANNGFCARIDYTRVRGDRQKQKTPARPEPGGRKDAEADYLVRRYVLSPPSGLNDSTV